MTERKLDTGRWTTVWWDVSSFGSVMQHHPRVYVLLYAKWRWICRPSELDAAFGSFPTHYGILILRDVDWPDMSYYWHQNSIHMQRHCTLLTTDCIGGIWATISNIRPDVKGKNIIKQVSFDLPLCWWFRWMTSRNGLDCSVKECGLLQSATEGLGLYLLFHHSWRCANESPDPKAQSTSLPPFKVAWVGKKT